MQQIRLQSSDGEIFEVDLDVAKMSFKIKTLIEGFYREDRNKVVPLPSVDSMVLKKILQWLQFHKDDNETEDEDRSVEKGPFDICSWDTELLRVDQDTLFKILQASSDLDIKGLLRVTCKLVANMVKNKTPEEMRQMFHIKNDLTPEEEEQIKKENYLCGEI